MVLVTHALLYEFQVYEALVRLLTEENRRLRESAERLGVVAERLNEDVRAAHRRAQRQQPPLPAATVLH